MKPVCLITGAGDRLGQALCSTLAADYQIIAAYRQTPPTGASQFQWQVTPGQKPSEGPSSNRSVFCVQADLTRREDIRRLVEVALARHGPIDAIINSAADTLFHGKLIELWQADEAAQSQLLLNCIAPMQLVSAVHEHCWKDRPEENAHRNRSVINVSSMSGLYVHPEAGQAFYAASKAALNMLTLSSPWNSRPTLSA